MGSVTQSEIAEGLRRLGLSSNLVAVHSSLRSFGYVQGAQEAVISALQTVCRTVLMPGFQCVANVLPPVEQRPEQNGCDYAVHFDLSKPPEPFDVEKFPI